jgi:hypothetical protein
MLRVSWLAVKPSSAWVRKTTIVPKLLHEGYDPRGDLAWGTTPSQFDKLAPVTCGWEIVGEVIENSLMEDTDRHLLRRQHPRQAERESRPGAMAHLSLKWPRGGVMS